MGAGSVVSIDNGYALGEVSSDVEEFLATREPHWWRGPYMQTLDDGTTPGLRDALLSALGALTRQLLPASPEEAARLGQIWLEMEPYDLEALHLTLRACLAQGEARSAERLYQQARTRLSEVSTFLPKELTVFLAS